MRLSCPPCLSMHQPLYPHGTALIFVVHILNGHRARAPIQKHVSMPLLY